MNNRFYTTAEVNGISNQYEQLHKVVGDIKRLKRLIAKTSDLSEKTKLQEELMRLQKQEESLGRSIFGMGG